MGFAWMPFSYMVLGPILKNAGFDVVVIDQRVQKNWKAILDKHLNDALWVGMSIIIGKTIVNALNVAKYIKSCNSTVPVVWGGWWPTVAQRLSLSHECVDYIAVGPGEEIVVPLSHYFLGKNQDKPETVFSKQDADKVTDSLELINKVTPSTKTAWQDAYSMVPDVDLYRSKNNVISLFAGMSCPYSRCRFCCIVQHYDYVMREREDILDELDFLIHEKKFGSIVFLDGLFFVGSKTIDLIRGFRERGFNIDWKGKSRSDSLQRYTPDEMKLLRETGMRVVTSGFESGSNKILKSIDKGVTAEDAYEMARLCRDFDLELQATYLFGLPGETVEDLLLSIEHIEKINTIMDKFYYSRFFYVPTPGTHTYHDYIETGGKVPVTLEGWGNMLWQNSPDDSINQLHWLSHKERERYLKIFNEYFQTTKAKIRTEWRHK
jgi:radical SAM superfamily enzyme YgiQ (UPF0313 family)